MLSVPKIEDQKNDRFGFSVITVNLQKSYRKKNSSCKKCMFYENCGTIELIGNIKNF